MRLSHRCDRRPARVVRRSLRAVDVNATGREHVGDRAARTELRRAATRSRDDERGKFSVLYYRRGRIVAAGDVAAAEAATREAISVLDRVAVKDDIHKNNAARRKSRLMAKFNALASA